MEKVPYVLNFWNFSTDLANMKYWERKVSFYEDCIYVVSLTILEMSDVFSITILAMSDRLRLNGCYTLKLTIIVIQFE